MLSKPRRGIFMRCSSGGLDNSPLIIQDGCGDGLERIDGDMDEEGKMEA